MGAQIRERKLSASSRAGPGERPAGRAARRRARRKPDHRGRRLVVVIIIIEISDESSTGLAHTEPPQPAPNLQTTARPSPRKSHLLLLSTSSFFHFARCAYFGAPAPARAAGLCWRAQVHTHTHTHTDTKQAARVAPADRPGARSQAHTHARTHAQRQAEAGPVLYGCSGGGGRACEWARAARKLGARIPGQEIR